jgi:hypothetical protein
MPSWILLDYPLSQSRLARPTYNKDARLSVLRYGYLC